MIDTAEMQIGAARTAAMQLALSVTRAVRASSGEAAELVVGEVAAGWHAALPIELQAVFAMTAEMALSAQLLKMV